MAYGIDKWDTRITDELRAMSEHQAARVMDSALTRMLRTLDMTIIEAISLELDPGQ